MYRFKERDVYRCLGQPDDLLYHASSGGGAGYSYWSSADRTEAQFSSYYADGQSKRGSSVYCPTALGREHISWESRGDGKYNPCTHYRTRLVNLPFSAWHRGYYYWWYPDVFYYEPYYRFASPAVGTFNFSQLNHPVVDYQATRARAWNNMQPRFEGKVSCINFLYELKDFRDIVKYLFKKEKMLKDLRRLFSRRRPDLSPKDPTRGIATAILVNNFAIQPLIKDISAMFQQANIIVREAQQQFFESGSQYQKSHYSEELNRVDSRSIASNNTGWYGSGYLETTIFTATLRYKYDYSMRNTVDAWMKYWGFCGSFEAFWNMIPFSFLADYFVQIGNSIHAMEHDPRVTLGDYEYGESLKTTLTQGYTTVSGPLLFTLVLDGNVYMKARGDRVGDRLLAGTEGTIYTRLPRTPYYGPATPRLKLPSTRQSLNICALLRCLF